MKAKDYKPNTLYVRKSLMSENKPLLYYCVSPQPFQKAVKANKYDATTYVSCYRYPSLRLEQKPINLLSEFTGEITAEVSEWIANCNIDLKVANEII